MCEEDKTVISEVLRQAIRDSGESINLISIKSGVCYPIIHHFVNEKRSMTLPAADKLCKYFGLELTPRVKPRRKK